MSTMLRVLQGSSTSRCGIRFFSQFRVIQLGSPIFDPSELNPIRNNKANPNESFLNLNNANARKRQQQQQQKQNQEQNNLLLEEGKGISSNYQLQPRENAMATRLTGVTAGRTIDVYNGDTSAAFRQLNSMVAANSIAQDRRSQRFYMKPGKVAEMKKSLRHRREFMMGFQRLMELVKDAKRKGY